MASCLAKQNFAKPPVFQLLVKVLGIFHLAVSKNRVKERIQTPRSKTDNKDPAFPKKEIHANFSLKSLASLWLYIQLGCQMSVSLLPPKSIQIL